MELITLTHASLSSSSSHTRRSWHAPLLLHMATFTCQQGKLILEFREIVWCLSTKSRPEPLPHDAFNSSSITGLSAIRSWSPACGYIYTWKPTFRVESNEGIASTYRIYWSGQERCSRLGGCEPIMKCGARSITIRSSRIHTLESTRPSLKV